MSGSDHRIDICVGRETDIVADIQAMNINLTVGLQSKSEGETAAGRVGRLWKPGEVLDESPVEGIVRVERVIFESIFEVVGTAPTTDKASFQAQSNNKNIEAVKLRGTCSQLSE